MTFTSFADLIKIVYSPDLPNPDTELNQIPCPVYDENLPDGIEDLQLFYHVGILNNWHDIVEDQLATLFNCGLGHYASKITVSYTNGDEESIRDLRVLLHNFENTAEVKIDLIPGPGTIPWESVSLNAIHDTCHAAKKKTVVFYFHNKGTSSYKADWRSDIHQSWSYSRSLYWRKFLEYFTLERPYLCLTAFKNGAYTCGPQLRYPDIFPMHYSGNFWSLHCDYLVQYPENITKFYVNRTIEHGITGHDARDWLTENRWDDYVSVEFWMGRGYTEENHDKFIGLYKRDKDLYKHLIRPKEYVMHDEEEATDLISGAVKHLITTVDLDNILEPLVAFKESQKTFLQRLTGKG